jgi:hypothetical protein
MLQDQTLQDQTLQGGQLFRPCKPVARQSQTSKRIDGAL